MGKYTPLSDFLKAQNSPSVIMSFAEIERVIGEKLPEQAGTRGWWRGEVGNNAVAEAWGDAGFAPDLVDTEERMLLFRRSNSGETPMVSWEDATPLANEHDPIFGTLKDVTHLVDGVDLTQPANPDWARMADAKTL